jgi:hypothetical protein
MELHPFFIMALIFVGGASLFAATVFLAIRSSWNRKARPQAAPLPILGAEDRTASLAQAADALGMHFEARPPPKAVEELSQFVLFSQGSRKTIYNRLVGSVGDCRIEVFDYYFDHGANKSRGGFGALIVVLNAPIGEFPQFDLRPTTSAWVGHCFGDAPSLLRRLYGAARTADESLFGAIPTQVKDFTLVEFPGRRRFGELYLVHADEPKAVERLFSEDVLTHFERHPGLYVEAKDGVLVYYRGDQTLDGDSHRWLGSPVISASDVTAVIREARRTLQVLCGSAHELRTGK